jgi:hypothetical protein
VVRVSASGSKFTSLVVIAGPNALAVVVPARHAYSHWASVGSLNAHVVGNAPLRCARVVSVRQNVSA